MLRTRPTPLILAGLCFLALVAACSADEPTPRDTASIEAVPTTTAPATTPQTTATTVAASDPEDVCPPNAGPNVRIRWEDLAPEWSAIDGVAVPEATLEAGTGQDSGQFSFEDGTIVQAAVSQNQGEVVELFVINQVDPADPMADLPIILGHWADLLTLTEPRLTATERVGILQALGVVGENLTLLDMNGTVECRQRTYEVLFDADLAAFVLGVDLSR